MRGRRNAAFSPPGPRAGADLRPPASPETFRRIEKSQCAVFERVLGPAPGARPPNDSADSRDPGSAPGGSAVDADIYYEVSSHTVDRNTLG